MNAAVMERQVAGTARGPEYDWVLLTVGVLLMCVGIVFVTSASVAIAERETGNALYFAERQAMYAGAGIVAAVFMMLVPLKFWRRMSALLLFGALGLLTLVLVPGFGHEVNGSVRWLTVGSVRLIQASEPARLLLFMFVADYLARRGDEVRTSFTGFAKPLAMVAIAAVLLLAEPDFGAAAVLVATVLGMLFIGGARLRDFFVLLVVTAGAMAMLVLTSPYRMERLTAFMNPWADPFDSGFQLTQALIAIGRGEWFGVGLGAGVQKLFYLPEAHTDFVFAVIAEELGLLGVLCVIALYVVFFLRCFRIGRGAARAGESYASHLAFGIGLWIGMQALINLGVNMGVLPTKGLTLPLISSGGSSLLVTCAAIGLVLRAGLETERADGDVWRKKSGVPGGHR
ncbi:MAG TPA: putative lipid II flippase FtsW [Gammaproteobacteria bacterium]